MYKTQTAPMGWNSWDCYGAAVTEDIVRRNAAFMAEHLKQYGWEYITVDIQWSEPTAENHEYHPFTELCMDEYSRLIPAVNRFPSSADGKGFAPLAEYVHSLGLKFGIHIMRGIPRQAVHQNTPILGSSQTARQIAKTDSICHWNTDMYGVDPEAEGARAYYDSLFALYASWGVDFIKCDDIARELPHEEAELILLSRSLQDCGRDMILSLSPGPALLEKAELYKQTSNMWRITDDFWDHWESLLDMFDRCKNWQDYVKDGGYPDCDMLPLGRLGKGFGQERDTNFTYDEQKTMLTLWTIFRSPLMLGAELTKLDSKTIELLTNKDVYEMFKKARGARETMRNDSCIVWQSESADRKYKAIFNITNKALYVTSDILEEVQQNAKELWSGKELGEQKDWKIPAHGVLLFAW